MGRDGKAPPGPGFVRGLLAVPAGVGFILKTPATWSYAMVPSLIALVTAGVLGAVSIWKVPGAIASWLGPAVSTWGTVGTIAAQVLATVAAVVLSALVGLALAQSLSGPALERIVRLHDRQLGAPERPPTSFAQDMLCSASSLLVSYAFGLPIIALLFVIGLLVPFAMVVTKPLELLAAAFTLAWDLFDYPMSVRGVPFGRRVTLVRRHLGAVLGFGLGLALCGLVPCLLFLLLPAGVAGAARVSLEIERAERTGR